MIDLILDPGHGGRESGVTGINGLKEKDCTLYICKKCKEILDGKDINTKLTRTKDTFLSISDRVRIANNMEAKYFISVHFNGASNLTASGAEVYYVDENEEGINLANKVLETITNDMYFPSRGIKTGDFQIIKETNMPSILIQICFLSNPKEEALLVDDLFKDQVAESLAKGILKFLGKLEDIEETKNYNVLTSILQESKENVEQVKQWAKNKGATNNFIALADLYWDLYLNHGGVNPTIAYVQAAIESNYGKFDNTLDESFKNPCRLKKLKTVEEKESECYEKFTTWKQGVEAHLDHLALYAGAVEYPRVKTADPRHFPYLYGVCKCVEDLSGKWSNYANYGLDILQLVFDISDTELKDDLTHIVIEECIETEKVKEVVEMENELVDVEGIRNKIISISESLDNMKEQYNKVLNDLNTLEKVIEKLDLDNKKLIEQNEVLSNELDNYKKGTEEIANLLHLLGE